VPEILGDESVGIKYAINGLLSLTPDGLPLLGETPEVKGLWSAAAVWVKEGPGVGKSVAEWMVHGEPEIDLQSSDIARFYPEQRTPQHVKGRAAEGFNKTYGIVHPGEQWESNRGVRVSPFYEREKELGAVFFEAAAWERPHWYESNAPLVAEYGVQPREHEWDARWWSPIINAEHLAMRDRAAMFDLTAFCVFDVAGPGALDCVQTVAARQMNVPDGRVVYTPVLAPGGGFKSDLTIMKMADDRFRVVTGGAHGMADMKWFRDHCGPEARIEDHTSSVCTVGLWGPRARDILSSITSDDVSNEAFPFATWKTIGVDGFDVVASRISYVGDLGWELYVPFEHGARLWDAVWEAGRPHGVVPAGIGVYGTTGRLEKAYRAFGFELDQDYDVVEADMAWWKVKSEDFVGKEAHLAAREREPAAVCSTLTLTGNKRFPLGREPIVRADGSPLVDAKGRRSYVTSAGMGPSLGKYILMTYLPPGDHGQLYVQYMEELHPVTVEVVGSRPPFDPENERIRS
jgi:glycine cleavage system aminomethyltransferase T